MASAHEVEHALDSWKTEAIWASAANACTRLGKETRSFRLPDMPDVVQGIYCRYSKDGTRLITWEPYDPSRDLALNAGPPRGVTVWDSLTAKAITKVGDLTAVGCVAFSPDGGSFVAGPGDIGGGPLSLRDTATGREIRSFKGPQREAILVEFSPDGKKIACASADHTLTLWDVAGGKLGGTVWTITKFIGPVFRVAFSPDGRTIATATDVDATLKDDTRKLSKDERQETLRLWNADNGAEIVLFKGYRGRVQQVAFSPDGNKIAAAIDNAIKMWDMQTGAEILMLQGHTNLVTHLAFSPDGDRIVSGSLDKTVKIWRPLTPQETLTVPGAANGPGMVALSPDWAAGLKIARAPSFDALALFDVASGKALQRFRGVKGTVFGVAFSPDGKRLVSACQVDTQTLRPWTDDALKLWNAQTGQEIRTLKGHGGSVSAAGFSSDGKWIISGGAGDIGSDKSLKVWDADSGKEMLSLADYHGPISSVAISPDGQRIACGSADLKDTAVRVRDVPTGRELLVLKGHSGPVSCVAFSPDGKGIVSGASDKLLKVWDAATGAEILTLQGHTRGIHCVAFSRDGKRIVSGGDDLVLRVWDADRGQETLTLKGHDCTILSLSFSRDATRIISGDKFCTFKIWKASSSMP